METTRQQQAETWLHEQFFILKKQTIKFNADRATIAETENIIRQWFKKTIWISILKRNRTVDDTV